MSKYTKQHYEDVARILRADRMEARIRPEDDALANVMADFADLFAADNPPNSAYCGYCGTDGATSVACPGRSLALGHSLVQHKGFDRARFLAACGLAPEHTCPLCERSSPDLVVIDEVHPECADREQAYSDYVAGKMAGELDE